MRKPETAGSYRWYALGVLTAVYCFNIADRYVISTLIEPIKAELGLSDTGVGFLTGTALALVYTGAGILLARIADRGDRRRLLAAAIVVWSTATALCGMAGSFLQLLLARVGVGLGEAGATPASQSMIADWFRFDERMVASAVFSVGAAVGATIGTYAAGALADAHGWRAAFLALAAPSLALAPLVWFTVREPVRGGADGVLAARAHVAVVDVLRYAWSRRALFHALVAGTVCTFSTWGLLWWTPAFLTRSYGLSTGEAGALLGWINLIGGTLGVVAGGWALQRVGRTNPRRQCSAVAAVMALATAAALVAYSTPSLAVTHAALWVFVPAAYIFLAPAFGWIQSLVPPEMRATACALFLFGSNIANLAIAPQFIGAASDLLAARAGTGTESLRYALVACSLTGFWGAWHYHRVARDFLGDMRLAGTRLEEPSRAPALVPAHRRGV